MLGKGLDSLIPKKQNGQPPHQDEQTNQQPTQKTDDFYSEKPEQKIPELIVQLPTPAINNNFNTHQNKTPLPSQSQTNQTLLTPSIKNEKKAAGFFKDAVFYIETEKIKPNPHQPRRDFNEESLKELANSIREHGILQPLIVSKIEKEIESGTEVYYQLIAGERRLRASQIAGLKSVPVIIKNTAKDAEHLEMAIVENLQRENLNPIETARAYAKLQDVFGLTQREIAQRLGKSRETIANALRLLNLPTEIQEAVSKNKINESQARLLLIVEDPVQQQNFFNEIISNSLSVRELRSRIKTNDKKDAIKEKQTEEINPEIYHLQEQLAELLSANVKIKSFNNQDRGGEIIIDFYSPEEIEGIIKKLSPENKLENDFKQER